MSAVAQRLARPRVQGTGAAGQERMELTAERRAMLAKVHVARKQLGLDEAAYRDVVERVTGVASAGQASDAKLHKLLAEFTRLGFRPARPARRSDKPNVRMIYAIWTDLQPHVEHHTPEALRAFVVRQTCSRRTPDGVSAPEFLDAVEANRVIEGLKAWLARARKGDAPKAETRKSLALALLARARQGDGA